MSIFSVFIKHCQLCRVQLWSKTLTNQIYFIVEASTSRTILPLKKLIYSILIVEIKIVYVFPHMRGELGHYFFNIIEGILAKMFKKYIG